MKLTTTELEAAHSALRRIRRRHSTMMIGLSGQVLSAEEEIEAIVNAVDEERQRREVAKARAV